MAYFPFMIDISGRKCLVVGGGKVAFHKIKILLRFGVKIFAAAPLFSEEFQCLKKGDGQVTFLQREFADSDIDGMDFVVAATGEESVNLHISKLCRERGILINVVDNKEACSFLFPAMIEEKDLLVAVSSGGKSPASVSYLKKKIQEAIPDYYGEMTEKLGAFRGEILRDVDAADKRRQIFYQLLAYGDTHGGDIPVSEVRRLIMESKCIKL